MEESITTKSGVRIYGYKNPHSHGFFISLFLRAGSMFEDERDNGITHFLEHISIRNVNKLMDGELYSELDRLGIEFNASTYYEMVQFYVSGAASNFAEGARLITELLSPIVLSSAEVDAERRRIKAEIREGDEKNSLRGFSSRIVHEGTNLARMITGEVGGVSKITKNRLEEYRKSVFGKDNIFFYVTGSFDETDLQRLSAYIDMHEPQKGKINENVAPVSNNFGKRPCEVYIKNSDFTSIRFNFDLDMRELSVPETDLLYDILLSGNNSDFYIEMSERRGLFYDIGGSIERYLNIGELSFSYDVRERDLYEAAELTVEILNKLKAKPLQESAMMKAGYVDNAEMLLDDIRDLNFTFAYDNHIMDLGYPSVSERRAAYAAVSSEQIMKAARKVFRKENLTLTVKGSKRKIDAEHLKSIISKL